ncbi:ABC transporter permease [Pseudoroseicyclus sp. CXY001]|uniref:ABC transporter permease n=1 Tax=Pseudoroseicyclus sp. CXY001 TaxID=3242492 RepID=UPI0035714139
MTGTTQTATHTTTRPATRRGIMKMLDEIGVFMARDLQHIPRVPEKLLDVTLQPLMFVLLFGYIFGSAIDVGDSGNYREFLMAGIFIQTLAFRCVSTATGIVTDFGEAVIDRFRVLPISSLSILVGRAAGEMIEGLLGIVVMALCGLLIGWSPEAGLGPALGGFALMIYFSFAMIALGAGLGLSVRTQNAAQAIGFLVIFPLTFASNAFVPIDGMPAVVRLVTDWSPVTPVVAALRDLFGNPNPIPADASWMLLHPVAGSLIWCTVLTVAGLGVAVWRFGARRNG